MNSKLFQKDKMLFSAHPKFDNVQMAVFVTGEECDSASVCMLKISPDSEIPVHAHDPQADSIFIAEGSGEAFVNGSWQPVSAGDYIFVPAIEEHGIRTGDSDLTLFVHHTPPLL